MIRKLQYWLLLLFITATSSFAQTPEFGYARKLSPVTEDGWHAIALPSSVFKYLREDYADIRLYDINGDTTEIPFVLRITEDELQSGKVELKTFNTSTQNKNLFVTFEVPAGQTVNHAEFLFEEDNFDAVVKLEGSDDRASWFEIVTGQRIVSLKTTNVDFRSSTVTFPESRYKYLRATISGAKLTFVSATFRNNIRKKGKYLSIGKKFSTTEDKAAKQTIINIMLNDFQPVSNATIDVSNDQDYYRYYSLEYLTDSAQTPKGWTYYYTPLSSGYLTSINQNEISFHPTATQKMRLTVFNADNLPLKIEDIRLSRPETHLIAKLSKDKDYYLLYGNESVNAPSYDLVHFTNKIPDSLRMITPVEDEIVIKKTAEKGSPLIQNPSWLWIILGAVVLLLGFFTLKMMRNKVG
jgi:hypothetical protein